jgi:membrane-associated phospholipid phosphatase
MFLTAPIVWLQSWASPGLTRTLEVVSWFGYTRVAIGLAVLFAFTVRLRAGMALLLLVGLNSLATDMIKTAAAMPRPFVADRNVRILGWPAPETTARAGEAANAADSEAGYGFPSGHVSTSVTLAAGLAILVGGRRLRLTGAAWVALMALSRLYLGRHFIGDVLGGVAVGAVVVGVGMTVLRLWALAESPVARETWRAALLNAVLAAALLGAALIIGRPDVADTGRLAGIAFAVLVLMWTGMVDVPPRVLTRAGLVVLAAVSYALMWGALTPAGSRVASSVLPAFAMLFVPAALVNRGRATAIAGRSL